MSAGYKTENKTNYKLEPKPSDDFPSLSEDDTPNFDFLKDLDKGFNESLSKGDDFSFGGSPEEIKEAIQRNEQLVSDGFELKQADTKKLKPKVYGSNGEEVTTENTIQKDWTDYGIEDTLSKKSTFIPKKEDNHWRELYYKQKAITATLEMIVEDLQRKA